MRLIDLQGQKRGRLTVLSRDDNRNVSGGVRWRCRCECGTEVTVTGSLLANGQTRSCGCLRVERMTRHGMHKSSEYQAWYDMRRRCQDPAHSSYYLYGARGISVHPSLHDFPHFLEVVGRKPSRSHSLDRKDNSLNYEPGNLRWATPREQANNRRSCRYLTLHGRTQSIATWSRELNLSRVTITNRLNRGLNDQSALSTKRLHPSRSR